MPEISIDENNIETLGDAIRIKSTDDIKSRMAMFRISTYFKREFHFDSFQYASFYDIENDNECYAYVWSLEKNTTKTDHTVIGAIVFRKRDWGGFGLQWVWLHPYIRNTGLLSRHWKLFEEKFGNDFFVEPPLSISMKNFLLKRNSRLHLKNPKKRKAPLWKDKFSNQIFNR